MCRSGAVTCTLTRRWRRSRHALSATRSACRSGWMSQRTPSRRPVPWTRASTSTISRQGFPFCTRNYWPLISNRAIAFLPQDTHELFLAAFPALLSGCSSNYLGGRQGINAARAWEFFCTVRQLCFAALHLMHQEGIGAVDWPVVCAVDCYQGES